MGAIGARTDVVLEGVRHPLRDLACEIELAPGTGSERRGPHRRDVRCVRAISGVGRIVAIVDRVLGSPAGVGRAPGVFALALAPRAAGSERRRLSLTLRRAATRNARGGSRAVTARLFAVRLTGALHRR